MSEQNNKTISLEERFFQIDAVRFMDEFLVLIGAESNTSFFEDVEK